MDETTRMIIAYAALLLGLPTLAAKIVWFVPGAVAGVILSHVVKGLDTLMGAVIEGFISLLFACLLFEHLQIPVVWKIPMILIIVSFLWNCSKAQAFNAFPSMAGIVTGFYLYPKFWLFVSMKLGLAT
jgi:hypothetical protein